jgi:predicted ester cyclase
MVIGQKGMSDGNRVQNIGPQSNTLTSSYNVHSDGKKLYIADMSNHRVLIYNSIPMSNDASADIVVGQPDMTSNVADNGGIGANTLDRPASVFTNGNRLFIVDRGNNRVLIYNTIPTVNGASADVVIGQPDMTSSAANNGGRSGTTLSTPFGVFTNGTKLFIADRANNRVLIFDTIPTGNGAGADFVIGQPDMVSGTANNGGIGANTLYFPNSVYSDGERLFISEYRNNRVLIFNNIPSSDFTSADIVIGQPDMVSSTSNNGGISANTLYEPHHIYSDGTRLFISDYSNNRVLIFNSIPSSNFANADVVIGQIDMTSNTINQGGMVNANTIYGTIGVAADDTRMYIADSLNKRVLIYLLGPQNISVTGTKEVDSLEALLEIAGDGIMDMMISEDPNFVGAEWVPFSEEVLLTLSGEGVGIIYVKFRDFAMYESEVFAVSIEELPETGEEVFLSVLLGIILILVYIKGRESRSMRNSQSTILCYSNNS